MSKPPVHCPVVRVLAAVLGPPLGGLLTVLAFPPFELWWVAWFALAPLVLATILADKWPEWMLGALLGGAAFHLAGGDWIRTSFRGEGLSGPWAMAWLTAGFVMAPSWVAVVVVARWLKRRRFPMSICMALGWMMGEFARRLTGLGLTEMDVPWMQLGVTQADFAHFVQVADIIGATGVGALVAGANGLWCDLLIGPYRMRSLFAAACVIFAIVGYGSWRLAQPISRLGPTVALMPANSLPGMVSASSQCGLADVLLWSEGVVQDDAASDRPRINELERFANEAGSLVVVGWQRDKRTTVMNSLVFAHPMRGIIAIHDKVYVVPWGEFSPRFEIPYTPRGGKQARRGTKCEIVDFANIRIAPAICYDACFAAMLRRFASPDCVLVASSERLDQTGQVAKSVQQIVRLRAIEFRRAIVRNATGGYSGIVDGCGRERSRVNMVDAPVRLGPIPIDNRISLYARWGDAVPMLGFVLLLVATVARSHLRRLRFRGAKQPRHRRSMSRNACATPSGSLYSRQ